MKAMVLENIAAIEKRPLILRDVPSPRCSPSKVLINVEVCGLCHTDLHQVEGDIHPPKLPVIPGHQVIGRVCEVGAQVQDVHVGDLVGVAWLHATCGQCRHCLAGNENLCEQALFTGFDVDGGYAEMMVAEGDFVYPLPPSLDPARAAPLLCGGIIGYRALRLSGIQPGERLGLFGFGSSASIAIQIARFWGCEVYVFTRSENHRRLAEAMGAAWVGGAEDTPPQPVDAAVIFAPAGRLVPQALRILRRGGTVALAGITMSPIPQMDYSLLYHERHIRSVANSTRRDAQELLRYATTIPIETHVQVFALEEANEALLALKESRLDASGVLRMRS